MNVYVVLFHDVWDLDGDPGVENEFGQPETTSIDAVFGSRALAEQFVTDQQAAFPELDPAHGFHTIEEQLLQ